MTAMNRIKVWDPLVRIFHWTLVIAFSIAYITEEDYLLLHTWAGYSVCVLLLVRLVWGVIGPRRARFTDFVQPPREVIRFLQQTLRLRAKRYLGHNPAGGAMIVLLLASLLLTTVTGIAVYGAGDNAGPLAGLSAQHGFFWQKVFEEVHEFFANFTLMLVFIHIAGVIVESLIQKENLIRSMFNGYKRADPRDPVKEKLS